jgi:hypothetical protein
MYQSWQFWAVMSAAAAALTAIFAKIGVANVSSNLATLIRTLVILAVTAAIVAVNREWQPPVRSPGAHIFSSGFPVWQPAYRGCVISGRSSSATRRGSRQSTS